VQSFAAFCLAPFVRKINQTHEDGGKNNCDGEADKLL